MSDSNGAQQKEKPTKVRRKPERESVSRHTFATARHNNTTSPEWAESHQQGSSLLQRQCACGTHTIGGGECQTCRQKRETGFLQRTTNLSRIKATTTAPPEAQTSSESNFNYDLSQVPIRNHTGTAHNNPTATSTAQRRLPVQLTVAHRLPEAQTSPEFARTGDSRLQPAEQSMLEAEAGRIQDSQQIQRQTGGPRQNLSAVLRGMLEVYGPVHYEGLIEAIHNASDAERRAVLRNRSLRNLITTRLTDEWAVTVMSSLLEGAQSWRNPKNNDFYNYFVVRNGSGTLPSTATMNCWESILYAAYLANEISAAWIVNFYTTALSVADPNALIWAQLGFSTALPRYPRHRPQTGQLLFYHTGGAVPGHVALSLGGDQAISLWNQPNNDMAVQRIRVTDLSGTVYVGDAPW
jgi:hypothetical protein